MSSDKRKIVCPACGSKNTAIIMYGLPDFSPDLMKEIKLSKTKLGGCCHRNDSPDFVCNDCGKEWQKEIHSDKSPN